MEELGREKLGRIQNFLCGEKTTIGEVVKTLCVSKSFTYGAAKEVERWLQRTGYH